MNGAAAGLWREGWRRLRRRPGAVVSLGVIGVYVLVALGTAASTAVPWIPLARNWNVSQKGQEYAAPSRAHWMGTDFLGRDVFDRALHGARIAVIVGLGTSLVAIPIGVLLGAVAGYYGGKVDEIIVWFYSSVASVPSLLLILALGFVLGPGLFTVCLAIGISTWVGICRLIRAETMKHREMDYVQAARAMGAGDVRIIVRHILPNVAHLIIVDFSLRFVYAIQAEAILAYVGVGVPGPSWGNMISYAKDDLIGKGAWWQLGAATGALFFLVLAANVLADALRDVLDPRLRGQALQ